MSDHDSYSDFVLEIIGDGPLDGRGPVRIRLRCLFGREIVHPVEIGKESGPSWAPSQPSLR